MVAPATMAASAPMTTATLVRRPIALSESTFDARSSVVTRKIPRNQASVARSFSAAFTRNARGPAKAGHYTSSGRTLGVPSPSVCNESAMAEWSPTISVLIFSGTRYCVATRVTSS